MDAGIEELEVLQTFCAKGDRYLRFDCQEQYCVSPSITFVNVLPVSCMSWSWSWAQASYQHSVRPCGSDTLVERTTLRKATVRPGLVIPSRHLSLLRVV